MPIIGIFVFIVWILGEVKELKNWDWGSSGSNDVGKVYFCGAEYVPVVQKPRKPQCCVVVLEEIPYNDLLSEGCVAYLVARPRSSKIIIPKSQDIASIVEAYDNCGLLELN